jgi:hypothetical protein
MEANRKDGTLRNTWCPLGSNEVAIVGASEPKDQDYKIEHCI